MANNHEQHHIAPLSEYIKVFAALVVLTLITVAISRIDLGALNAPVAFLVATVKAVLVMLYFMHLKHDSTINRVIFGSGFFFLVLLFFFSILDIWTRILQTNVL
jgi:cytochrome c oxidase subunit 4